MDDDEPLDCVCCAMSERRISGWFVLSAVFVVAVFGLFFTFTERRTWPEHRTELSAADMRLVPSASTLWCEAVALHSDHPFVAYQVSTSPFVNPLHLSRQEVSLNLRLSGGSSGNTLRLRYYLLPGSTIDVRACANREGARVLIFQGEEDVSGYLQYLWAQYNDDSSESYSAEDSYEQFNSSSKAASVPHPLIINNQPIPLDPDPVDGTIRCEAGLRPVRANVTSAGFYVIAVLNTNRFLSNGVGLRIVLDRARYTVQGTGRAFDMCSLATDCTIGLSFASQDRALVWIPDEPNAGRTSFEVRSQCKPRLAVFAVLSVFFPLVVFLAVAFVVRADRERILRAYRGAAAGRVVTSPLLAGDVTADAAPPTSHGEGEEPARGGAEEQPPAYHTLYDSPPPYACVKQESGK